MYLLASPTRGLYIFDGNKEGTLLLTDEITADPEQQISSFSFEGETTYFSIIREDLKGRKQRTDFWVRQGMLFHFPGI